MFDIPHDIRVRSYPVRYSTSSPAIFGELSGNRQAFEKKPMNGKLFGTGRISVSSLGKSDIRKALELVPPLVSFFARTSTESAPGTTVPVVPFGGTRYLYCCVTKLKYVSH
jgi:hypothetical protein